MDTAKRCGMRVAKDGRYIEWNVTGYGAVKRQRFTALATKRWAAIPDGVGDAWRSITEV